MPVVFPLSREVILGDLTPGAKKFIKQYGKRYIPALLPDDVDPGRPGTCFDTCALNAAKHKRYIYVEGMARASKEERWMLHAWLTDGTYAYDPTWHCETKGGVTLPIPGDYIGIKMDIYAVARFIRATEYQGILGSRWRNPYLADQAIYSFVTKK